MVMKDFVECRVKTPFKPIQSPLWTGEQAEYEGWNQGARIDWVFRVTYKGNVGVFLAVNEMRIHMKDRLPTYKAMMDSLVILTAEPTPVAVLKPIITPEPIGSLGTTFKISSLTTIGDVAALHPSDRRPLAWHDLLPGAAVLCCAAPH